MRGNAIKIFIVAVVLLLTACGGQSTYYSQVGYVIVSENTQEVPPRIELMGEQPSEPDVSYSEEVKDIIEPDTPLLTEEDIVCLVPPTLEHDIISFCLPLNDWQEAFMNVLRGYVGREFETVHGGQVEASFFLHDINLDGIPELFVGDLFRFQTYFAIYRFYNGEAVSIENNISSGYGGFFVNPERAGFLSVDGWTGWLDETFFYLDEQMNINSVRFYRTFYDVNETVQQEPFWQEIDGIRVTEVEFEESFYRLVGSTSYWNPVIWHQNDEAIFREIISTFN